MAFNHLFWTEKYRPKTIEDCILTDSIRKTFEGFIEKGEIPALLLSGPPGGGKTTSARALCEALGYNVLFVNASNEGRLIDHLREKVGGFCKTNSIDGSRKVVLMDEFDFCTDLVQGALRGFIEEYSKIVTFIFTANNPKKIMDAIASRCFQIDFTVPQSEKKTLASAFFKRACGVLQKEGIEYDPKSVAALVAKNFGDWRKILNNLQGHSASNGKIDAGVLASKTDGDLLIGLLRNGDFMGVRKWLQEQSSINLPEIVQAIDEKLAEYAKPEFIPAAIILFADYLHKHVTSLDPMINALAMLVQIMADAEWKQ